MWNLASAGLREFKLRYLTDIMERYPFEGIAVNFLIAGARSISADVTWYRSAAAETASVYSSPHPVRARMRSRRSLPRDEMRGCTNTPFCSA